METCGLCNHVLKSLDKTLALAEHKRRWFGVCYVGHLIWEVLVGQPKDPSGFRRIQASKTRFNFLRHLHPGEEVTCR